MSDASLTLADCTIAHTASALEEGGSISAADNSQLTILRTRFEISSATKGGFIKVSQEASLDIEQSTFVAGQAAEGGAIRCQGDCNVVDSLFIDNTATKGAAIQIKEAEPPVL